MLYGKIHPKHPSCLKQALGQGPGDVPRLGALIQCFVTALKDHSFTDFEDFETSMMLRMDG
jgi:hypothetical protein